MAVPYCKRTDRLKKRLKKDGLDGLLIAKKENAYYISGFDGDDSFLLITAEGRDYIITDSRFKEKAAGFLRFDTEIVKHSAYAAIERVTKRNKIERLGFESDSLSYNSFLKLRAALKKKRFIPKINIVEGLRMIKDEAEVDTIKKAVTITKKAYLHAMGHIHPRHTGRFLSRLIDNSMRKFGAERPAFQTIVAQNPYSSHPHASCTNEPFGNNSAVLVDMGASYEMYNSDLTRILFLGRITTKFKCIYNIIERAQELAIKEIRPGIKISLLDRIARGYISNKGLGKYFIHSLGHGIGLQGHEMPGISGTTKGRLKPGMVLTIEPGIYIKGWGGLRMEDMVLVTRDGCEVLTGDIPK